PWRPELERRLAVSARGFLLNIRPCNGWNLPCQTPSGQTVKTGTRPPSLLRAMRGPTLPVRGEKSAVAGLAQHLASGDEILHAGHHIGVLDGAVRAIDDPGKRTVSEKSLRVGEQALRQRVGGPSRNSK